MITTLPGVYLFSVGVLGVQREVLSLDKANIESWCNVRQLRTVNRLIGALNVVLFYGMIRALSKRHKIAWKLTSREHSEHTHAVALKGALLLYLFPIHFFFQFVYYTDVGSVFVVILMYYLSCKSWNLSSALVGAVAILFRQTNVIWVAFAIGTKSLEILGENQDKFFDGSLTNVLFRVLPTAARCWKTLLLKNAAHLLLLGCFVGFVVWNGGDIVVGDRTAHKPSMHLPQMLYFSGFSTLFLGPGFWAPFAMWGELASFARWHLDPSHFLLRWTGTIVLVATMACSIKFCTIAHPYLLADNRHFTFYVWKGWFRRGAIFRLALIPAYLLAGFRLVRATVPYSVPGNKHGWQHPALVGLGLLVCTALALVPAPMIEPRYFMLPFILLQLHAPTSGIFSDAVSAFGINPLTNPLILYVGINMLTLVLFIYRPFTWPDGSVARFMW
jgi:alpha-1,2-glucosyltransferase